MAQQQAVHQQQVLPVVAAGGRGGCGGRGGRGGRGGAGDDGGGDRGGGGAVDVHTDSDDEYSDWASDDDAGDALRGGGGNVNDDNGAGDGRGGGGGRGGRARKVIEITINRRGEVKMRIEK